MTDAQGLRPKALVRRVREALGVRAPWSALACACLPGLAFGGPSGGKVVAGSASISAPDSATTHINQSSHKAVINWQTFSIAGNEYVSFTQPSSTAVALNRVVGGDPSSILGRMSANGRVFLVNPRGIYFGRGAEVDVGGLVASIFDIRNEDFLAGRYVFFRPPDAPDGASVINEGVIRAKERGFVVLAGDYVANHGVIQAKLGTVALGAGKGMTLELDDGGLVSFVIDEAAVTELAGVENTGELYADGGHVLMTAKVAAGLVTTAVNQSGRVQANGIVESEGKIYLTADGGNIEQAGTIVSDTQAPGRAGTVHLTATGDVILTEGSRISASGAAGGVHAGGEVRVVADGALEMRVGSEVRVDGGVDGGDGGYVELSGRDRMQLDGTYSGRARHVQFTGGTLFIDPTDVDITTSPTCGVALCFNPDTDFVGFMSFAVSASNDIRVLSPIGNEDLNGGDPGGKLTLIASNNIKVQAPIGSSGSRFRHDLELLAGNDVDIDDDIYIDNATPLKLVADTSGESDGAVVIQASGGNDVTVDALGSIEVSGDDFDVLGGTSGAVTVRAGTNLSVNLTGDMTVQGGTESISTTGSGTFEKIADALVKVGNNITVNADGDLTVKGGTATARASVSDESASRRAIVNATLSADNKVDITVGGDLVVSGGLAIASAFGDDPGNRIALAEATGRIEAVSGDVVVDVAGDLKVHAGSADASAEGDNDTTGFSDSQSATAEANVEISAGRDVVIEVLGGNLEVLGPQSPLDVDADASGNSNFAVNVAIADANAAIGAGRDIVSVAPIGGSLTVRGAGDPSDGPDADASESGRGTAVANGNASITAVRDLDLTVALGVSVTGGDQADAEAEDSGTAQATASATALIEAGGALSLRVISGGLVVAGGADVEASAEREGSHTATANADASILGATVSITVDAGGVSIRGGDDASAEGEQADDGAFNEALATANAKVHATGDLTVNVNGGFTSGTQLIALRVRGGDRASASVSEGGGTHRATVHADAELSAGRDLAVTITTGAGDLVVRGGDDADAFASASETGAEMRAVATANALVSAGRNATVDAGNGTLTVRGGDDADADGTGSSAPHTAIASADAALRADDNLTVSARGVNVSGGSNAGAFASDGTVGPNVAIANAHLGGGGLVTLDVGTGGLAVRGGNVTEASATDDGTNSATANANAVIHGTTVDIDVAGGGVLIAGGSEVDADATDGTSAAILRAQANGRAQVAATGNLTLTIGGGGLTVSGGDQASAAASFGGRTNEANVDASAELLAGLDLTVNVVAGALTVRGGGLGGDSSVVEADASGSTSLSQNTAQARADGLIAAGNDLALTVANALTLAGGTVEADVDDTFGGGSLMASATASARALVSAGGAVTVIADSLNVLGGTARADFSDLGAGGELTANADAGAQLGLDAGLVTELLGTGAPLNLTINPTAQVSVNVVNGISVLGGSAMALEEGLGGGTGLNSMQAFATAQVSGTGTVTLLATNGPIALGGGLASTSGGGVLSADAQARLGAGLLSLITSGDVQNGPVTIDAGALLIAAGGDVDLSDPLGTVTVGTGTVPAAGDPFVISTLPNLGIAPPPQGDPNAVVAAGGTVSLGHFRLDGSYPYVVLQGADVVLNQPLDVANFGDILIQWKPPLDNDTIGVHDQRGPPLTLCAGGPCGADFFNALGFSQAPGTTHVIGSGAQTGLIQVLEPMNIGSHNMAFAGPTTGLGNITTTGIVGILEAVVAAPPPPVDATVFIVPTVAGDLGGNDVLDDDDDGGDVAVEQGADSLQGGSTSTETDSDLMCAG